MSSSTTTSHHQPKKHTLSLNVRSSTKTIGNHMRYNCAKLCVHAAELWTHDFAINHFWITLFRFLRSESDDQDLTWEKRIAKKYYDKLFKEYALVELKYYKEGRVAMRWRTQKEVVRGKGMSTWDACDGKPLFSTKSKTGQNIYWNTINPLFIYFCPDNRSIHMW